MSQTYERTPGLTNPIQPLGQDTHGTSELPLLNISGRTSDDPLYRVWNARAVGIRGTMRNALSFESRGVLEQQRARNAPEGEADIVTFINKFNPRSKKVGYVGDLRGEALIAFLYNQVGGRGERYLIDPTRSLVEAQAAVFEQVSTMASRVSEVGTEDSDHREMAKEYFKLGYSINTWSVIRDFTTKNRVVQRLTESGGVQAKEAGDDFARFFPTRFLSPGGSVTGGINEALGKVHSDHLDMLIVNNHLSSLPEEELPRFVYNAVRIMTPGGRLLIRETNPDTQAALEYYMDRIGFDYLNRSDVRGVLEPDKWMYFNRVSPRVKQLRLIENYLYDNQETGEAQMASTIAKILIEENLVVPGDSYTDAFKKVRQLITPVWLRKHSTPEQRLLSDAAKEFNMDFSRLAQVASSLGVLMSDDRHRRPELNMPSDDSNLQPPPVDLENNSKQRGASKTAFPAITSKDTLVVASPPEQPVNMNKYWLKKESWTAKQIADKLNRELTEIHDVMDANKISTSKNRRDSRRGSSNLKLTPAEAQVIEDALQNQS